METLDHYLTQAKDLRNSLKLNSEVLNVLRDNSISQLEEMNVPNRKVENWKYTNLKSILSNNYSYSPKENDEFELEKNEEFINLVFENGKYNESKSDEVGLNITPLKNLKEGEALDYLAKTNYFSNDFANILNIANFQEGYSIELCENLSIEKPILIHNLFNGENKHISLTNVFIINKNSHLTILESISSTDNVFLSYSSHAMVKENSTFNHTHLQDSKHGSLVTMNINSEIYKSGLYRNVMINTGAKTSRTNLYLSLEEEHAEAQADGLYALHKDQHHDTMSYIHHNAPNTESKQLYKGILGDESRGVFTGRVRVEQNAQLINAKQLNKNLLLTKKAHANSRPQLEIYADDVKCAHGSTTGQISEDELFYFESRGINKEKARSILARAFAYDVVLNISNLIVRDFIKKHLLNKNIVR